MLKSCRVRPTFGLLFFVVGLLFGSALARAAEVTDPHIIAWITARTYARVYETASDKTSGNAVSTWPRSGLTNGGGGQATPVYSDVQRVVYSTNYVYVYATGLPSYVAGNWVTPNNMVYTSWPANRASIHRIPRTPSIPATKQKSNGSGGVLVNGVYVWANGDAQSYSTSTGLVSMSGQGIWNRLAGVAEAFNFDPAKGHQPNNGVYHNHVNPIALRYQLGDAVTYNSSTKAYAEGTPTKHSPLLGFANDGLPIYGPYGYATATNANSGIRRMVSGFVKRNGATTNKTTNQPNTNLASTGRTTLPVWAASVQGKSTTLSSSEYGPATTTSYTVGGGVTSTYSIGLFAEDYDYLGDLGYTQGTDFDLNRQNVRYCVTPEYPSGTYAYFVCIDSTGTTVFPDIINQEFYGSAAMGPGTVTSITETVTEYLRGGQASPLTLAAATASGGSGVTLTWPSVEGATYKLETSSDGSSYTTLAASIASAGGTTTSYTTSTLAAFYKVTFSDLATYDSAGNGGVIGKGSTAVAASPVAVAPTITTEPASKSVASGASVTFTVVATGTAPFTYQWFKEDSPLSGKTSASLTINPASAADAADYHVTVTNSAGTDTSAVATLTVLDKPAIFTPPASQTVNLGGSVTFTVEVTGSAPFTYQWRKGTSTLSGQTASTLTLDSVTASLAGNYNVVVTNSVGSATSASATLTVLTPPSITSGPASRSVFTGASVTFSVTATGTAPFTYQWFKGESPIDNATSSSLELENLTPANSGDYHVVVTNSVSSATSASATLVVTDPPLAPTIVTPPAAQSVSLGGSATFSLGVSGTAPFTYQWCKDGAPISGQTSATLTLNPVALTDAASYSVVVSNSAGSATSAAARLTVTVPAPAALALLASLPLGSRVSASLAEATHAGLGLSYRASGLPTGLTLDATTGALSGLLTAKPATYTIRTWCQLGKLKGPVLTTTLAVTGFPAAFVGSSETLLTDAAELPVAKLALTVSASGTFTGTLTTAADSRAFALKGRLELSEDNTSAFVDLSVSRGKNIPAYTLHLACAASPRLAATLTLDAALVGASTEGAALKTYAAHVVEPAAARYTLSLAASENLGSLTVPAGSGYASATVNASGRLSLSGKLADGAKLTGSFSLDSADTYRLFVKPQAASGSALTGWLPLAPRESDPTRYAARSSDVYWSKPASTAKLYPAGFGPLALDLTMEQWIKPTATSNLLAQLGLDSGGDTLAPAFSGGDVANFTLPTSLALSTAGAFTVADEANPSAFRLSVNTSTGVFTGSFKLKDSATSRSVTFQGVLLQLPASDQSSARGRGYFLLTPAVSGEATVSGSIDLALL